MEALVPLLAELNDLKRQATASAPSLAGAIFNDAWRMLLAGSGARQTALALTSRAVAAARLGGIDARCLAEAGLDDEAITDVLERSFDAVATPLDELIRGQLRGALRASVPMGDVPLPCFVQQLAHQPRAGATCPGRARVVVLPAESHADHCAMVAVYSVLVAPYFGADVATPFLAALIHHAHNAYLPDGGFTGEEMLGDSLRMVMGNLRERAFREIPEQLRGLMRSALDEVADAGTPEARAFHAADVLDRVLQMRWFEQATKFTLRVALEDMELVHAGPVQEFHRSVLRDAGLW